MKIVIDIDDLLYERIEKGKDLSPQQYDKIELAIVDGTSTIGSYEQGYNAAKREIALSGEYERAYNRGYEQACKDKIDTPYKEADDDYKNI